VGERSDEISLNLDAIRLKDWPFSAIPVSGPTTVWSGRPEVRDQIDRLVSRWDRRPNSEIVIFWAAFGQGKTHTLHFLEGTFSGREHVRSHYVQLPSLSGGATSPFVALYKQVMLEYPLDALARVVFRRFEHDPLEIFSSDTGLVRSVNQLLWLIATNAKTSTVARQWFRGDRISVSDLRSLKISNKNLNMPPSPRSPQDCQNVLDGILSVELHRQVPNGKPQFMLLIDEFQRVGELPPSKMKEVCDSLHLIYNRHSSGFRLVLTFATGSSKALPTLITMDLRSRVQAVIELPILPEQDACSFVAGLLRQSAIDSGGVSDWAPFTETAVRYAVKWTYSVSKRPSLRIVSTVFDHILNRLMEDYPSPTTTSETPFDEEAVKSTITLEAESLHTLIADADAPK